jgi:hypothetical protein
MEALQRTILHIEEILAGRRRRAGRRPAHYCSSQAFCFNLFFPFLAADEVALRML